MSDHSPEPAAGGSARRSLRFQLIAGVNAAMVVVLGAFPFWDYHRAWARELDHRRTALRAEAETLAWGSVHLLDAPADVLQAHIDAVCHHMRESSSPGHHIAVIVGNRTFQATGHRAAYPGLVEDLRHAATMPHGLGPTKGGHAGVGMARGDGVTVLTSEYVTDIAREARDRVLARIAGMAAFGIVLGMVVNLFVAHYVSGPLHAIVAAVHRIRSGEMRAQAPPGNSREFAFLAREFNAMSAALADAEDARRGNMDKARRIQENLVPAPEVWQAASAAFHYSPAEQVAGDYLDVCPSADGSLVFCVADATGHGVPASLLAAMLKTLFTAAVAADSRPEEVLRDVNERFSAVTLDEDFASLIVIAVDRTSGTVRHASAGHEPAYLLRADGEIVPLPSTGPVVGVSETASWENVEVAAAHGDRLVVVTDGLAETASPSGEQFGRQRIEALLGRARGEPLAQLIERVVDAVTAHRGVAPQADDITVLAVEI